MSDIGLLLKLPLNDMREMLEDVKSGLNEVLALSSEDDAPGPEERSMLEIILKTIESAETELKGVKDFQNLSVEKQARVLADLSLVVQFMNQSAGDDFDDFDDDDFDDDDFEEEEEKGCGKGCGHNH